MRGVKLLPVFLILAVGWFIFVSPRGAKWFAQKITSAQSSGPAVGRLLSADGPFKRIFHGGVEELTGPLSEPLTLHDGDRLEIDRGSRAVMVLNSQDEIELQPLSAISLHLWNPKDMSSPVYVQWLNGEITSRKNGVRGKAYLVRDGRLYFPGQKPSNKPLALTVLKNAPLDLQLADEVTPMGSDDDFLPDDSVSGDTTSTNEADGEGDGTNKDETSEAKAGRTPDTLSNEYIDEMIQRRQGSLQKCWLTRLKEKPALKGQITLQFEISKRGKVRELRVIDSDMNDDVLKRCVMSVVERISFRGYGGQEIQLSYPIRFN